LLLEFDEAWDGSSIVGVETLIGENGAEAFRRVAIFELVKIDLQRSWLSDQPRELGYYLDRFPELGDVLTVDAELVATEYLARRQVENDLNWDDYAERYPTQAPKAENYVQQFQDSQSIRRTATVKSQASIDTSRIRAVGDQKTKPGTSASDLPVDFGRYRIIKELGSGAMGKVYLAHDEQLDRQVALKTPFFSGSDSANTATRFYREARAAAKLQHRNICPIYDVGEIEGRLFISMAFVKGRCMSDYIKSDKPPPQRTSAILVQRLAVALSEAHKHNVIHRDLKPANIMIDLKKEPIVMDFGLARQTDAESRLTQAGTAVGTPAYMSPEQIRGELDEVGPAADIYALGVILYELLTGRLPFQGPISKVVYGIVHEEPAAPSTIRQDIDSELEAICAKMMAKNSAERFQSMDQVARALKAYVKGEVQTQKSELSSSRDSNSPSTNSSNSVTETGALNAFFAAHAGATASGTHIESSRPVASTEKSQPAKLSIRPSTSRGNRRVGRRLIIASGFAGGILGLLGVVIYFNGGKIELDDDSDTVVKVTEQGDLLITPSQSRQNQPPNNSNQEMAWEQLIDPTLSNWVRFPSRLPIGNDWLVSNGNLRMARASSGDICTRDVYGDFELQFEWKLGKNGNSGVIYRVAPGSQVSWQAGPEYQLFDEFNASGSLKQEQRTGAIYGVFPPENAVPNPVGQWNQSRIIARGPHIEHWLNGSKVTEAEIGSRDWDAALRRYGRLDEFPNFAKSDSGYIVLQSHRSEITYRNIRLREIDSERQSLDENLPPQPELKAGMGTMTPSGFDTDVGFVPLFQSDSLDGWSGLFDRWRLGNGELIGSAPEGVKLKSNTVLCSDKNYRDFELRFDAILDGASRKDGPNSGIQFRSTLLDRTDYKVGGPQLDIGGQFWGGLWGENTNGLIFQPDSALIDRIVDANNWNSYRLRVEGARVTIHINDTLIVSREIPGMPEEGLIGFQLHRGKVMSVRFRNVRIKELPSDRGDLQIGVAEPSSLAGDTGPSTVENVNLLNEWEHGGQNSPDWHLACVSPGGRRIAFRIGDRPLQISDTTSKQMLTIPPEMGDAISLAFSADGRLIATGHDNKKIRLWDAKSFEPVGEPFESPIEQRVQWVHLSADGSKLIAMGNDHSKLRRTSNFHTWEIASRKLISRFEADIDGQRWSKSIDASADGTLVAVVSHRNGPQLWDTRTGDQVSVAFEFDKRLAGMMRITGLDLSSDGSRLAYGTLWGSPSYAAILDTATGKELWNSGAQGGRVHCVQFTSDGKWLATTAGRTQTHQLSLWDVSTGDEVKRWDYDYDSNDENASTVKFLSFSEDGSRLLLTGGHMPVAVWGIEASSTAVEPPD
jgi:serine/threonine protein kinase/WD40 repeat protein